MVLVENGLNRWVFNLAEWVIIGVEQLELELTAVVDRIEKRLEEAFPFLDVKEFKELELPSEAKQREEEKLPLGVEAKQRPRRRKKEKQLTLFFLSLPLKIAVVILQKVVLPPMRYLLLRCIESAESLFVRSVADPYANVRK